MKICVLFDSKTGNTRQLAERICAPVSYTHLTLPTTPGV